MDESGHSGDTGAADSGDGAESRERTRVNGWATPDSPWSTAGAALESEDDIPAWRRPAPETRPFPRAPERPFGTGPIPVQPSSVQPSSGAPMPAPAPPGFVDARQSGEIPSSGEPERWGEGRSRYSDLLAPLAPEQLSPELPRPPRSEPGLTTGGFGSREARQGAGGGFGGQEPGPGPGSFGSPATRPEPGQNTGGYGSPATQPGESTGGFGSPATQPGQSTGGYGSPARPGQSTGGYGSPAQPGRNTSGPGQLGQSASSPAQYQSTGSPAQHQSAGGPAQHQSAGGPAQHQNTGGAPVQPGQSTSGFDNPPTHPGLNLGGFGSPAGTRPAPLRAFDVPTPSSAPPYPYEGDLDDSVPPPPPQRATTAVPLVRPAAPGGRRADWIATDLGQPDARHALNQGTPAQDAPIHGTPVPASGNAPALPPPTPGRVEPTRVATQPDKPVGDDAKLARPTYDPSTFPRRLGHEPTPAAETSGYTPPSAYSGFGGRDAGPARPGDPGASRAADPAEQGTRVLLPQRVPAQPDVPRVPEPPLVEPTAETPALARIATHLRRGDVLPAQDRQEGFDVQAILAAVREVAGVRDASLRTTPAGAHSLRLDLAEGADPAEVSRRVARLLQDRMGLDAAMKGDALPPPPVKPRAAVPVSSPPPPVQSRATAPVSPGSPPSLQSRATAPVSPPAPQPRSAAPVSAPPTREKTRQEKPAQHERPDDVVADEPRVTTETAVVPTGVESPPRPLYPAHDPGPRIVIENVQVNTFGLDATVEVRLAVGGRSSSGEASGPAVDGYLLRLCAMATAAAVDQLVSTSDHPEGPVRCFVEHAAAVPFGASQVAVAVLLLSCNGWVEQLAGSAVVTGDDRLAMVRATLAAVNRRLEALLSG